MPEVRFHKSACSKLQRRITRTAPFVVKLKRKKLRLQNYTGSVVGMGMKHDSVSMTVLVLQIIIFPHHHCSDDVHWMGGGLSGTGYSECVPMSPTYERYCKVCTGSTGPKQNSLPVFI